MRPSAKCLSAPRSEIRTMFSLAAGYPDALSLGIGEPDFPTPEHIREAG